MGISIGLVGLGAFGANFAEMFKSHPEVDKIALCDMEADRLAYFAEKESFKDKFNSKDAFTTFDEIVEEKLDAIVIITQPWLHAPQAVKAMQKGKHVYSAVPIISVPDGDEILDWTNKIVETSHKTGMRYMLGETTYYRPQTMYCRKRAAEGAFGEFLFAEGEYFHDIDSLTCSLREVTKRRTSSKSGLAWLEESKKYKERNLKGGPMFYPTHSVSGPMSVMNAHALKVSAFGYDTPDKDFEDSFANETALFQMSNGASMRICEYRKVGLPDKESFNLIGSEGSFYGGDEGKGRFGKNKWFTKAGYDELSSNEIRDSLPEEVLKEFEKIDTDHGVYGGHGGSHAYLVHEFVDSIVNNRQPVINAWEAARYMAAGVTAHKSALAGGTLLDVPDWGDAPE